MKIYIINLERDIAKKRAMERQLEELGITNYEFFSAIDGRDLSDEELQKYVYDYPACQLTLGEIGCALSHYYLYKKIVENNEKSALILEDDINLSESFSDGLEIIEQIMQSPKAKVLVMGLLNRVRNKPRKVGWGDYQEYPVISAYGTYGYAINQSGAKNLLHHLLPIRYEADMFRYFQENGWIEEFHGLYPPLLRIVDNHDELSNIQAERKLRINNRKRYRINKILQKRPFGIRLKARIMRILWKFNQVKFDNKD